MERLVLLCARQSRASPSAQRAPADTPQDKQQEAGSRWGLPLATAPVPSRNGFSQHL